MDSLTVNYVIWRLGKAVKFFANLPVETSTNKKLAGELMDK